MTVESLENIIKRERTDLAAILAELGVNSSSPERAAATIPFCAGDVTAGCENELQTAVMGSRQEVDLPRYIQESNYYLNIVKRHRKGELPKKSIDDLEEWLSDNRENLWENSWVRVPRHRLSVLAKNMWLEDVKADKVRSGSPPRSDADKFHCTDGEKEQLRVPVSYLLKLALVDCLGQKDNLPPEIRKTGLAYADHYISDNTSPETHSFHIVPIALGSGNGKALAQEACRRFLLTQLLASYAEKNLGLAESGQKLFIYFSPNPPVRQKRLSKLVSDAFYRELFMNPCLAGWTRGEEKHRYMHMCHQVLSRAQFNALGRLKEAGIITNDLVVLPSASNISLANNGTHISLASRKLDGALKGYGKHFSVRHEKMLGDLVIKIVEHFLPLLVGQYSAAPFRLGFEDFHPENLLSFLPYELDYTHLRMIWRRWRKKAKLKIRPLGLRLTPFGPGWLDRPLGRLAGLKGDYIPDYRLIDYLCVVMSTKQSPGLDGSSGNHQRLKRDLADLGVFDSRMPLYMLYRQREYALHGFSGFEGRIYSLFPGLMDDMARATDMQCLLTALAYKLIAEVKVSHAHIPDDPEIENERRQIFFGSAIGLPTFFIKRDSPNLFLRDLVAGTEGVRNSRRYPDYLRVRHHQYRSAAAAFICREGRELIEQMGMEETFQDLLARLERPDHRSALGKLSRQILSHAGAKNPFEVGAHKFNSIAEDYFRNQLRERHIKEAWQILEKDLAKPMFRQALVETGLAGFLGQEFSIDRAEDFFQAARAKWAAGLLEEGEISALINLVLLAISCSARQEESSSNGRTEGEEYNATGSPIYRTA